MMESFRPSKMLIWGLAIAIFFALPFSVLAQTNTSGQSLNVTLTIPALGGGIQSGGGGTSPPPPASPPAGPTATTTTTTPPAAADTTPPQISGISATPAETGASIVWQTDEPADSQVLYGRTAQYGSSASEAARVTSHQLSLTGLIAATTYHYQVISTDAAGNSGASSDRTFTTQPDSTPPPDVSNLTLTASVSALALSWQNPSATVAPDFSGVRIVRQRGRAPTSGSDGTAVFQGSGTRFTDTTAAANTTYYYLVISADTSGNESGGVETSGRRLSAPPAEVCDNQIDDDGDGETDCADANCATATVCQAPVAPITPPAAPAPEVCDNGVDDDGNGQADCNDQACVGFAACAVTAPAAPGASPVTGPAVAPGAVYAPPATTVGSARRIDLTRLGWYGGGGTIRLESRDGTVTLPAGASLSVVVPEEILLSAPQSITLVVDGNERHRLAYQPAARLYRADLTAPRVGPHQSYLEIDYGGGRFDSLAVVINSLPWGQITADGAPVVGVAVALLQGGRLVDLSASGQRNPQATNGSGLFVWVVPNEEYQLRVTKAGYYERKSLTFPVANNTINLALELVAQPPPLATVIDPTKTLAENIVAVTQNVAAKTKALGKRTITRASEAADNPKVEKAAETVVAPSVVVATAVGTVAVVGWVDLLPFLRYLFLQPLLLLGRRRRAGWGQVYNALNKLPVDLATVRLIDTASGRVLQTRVTDRRGRYAFVVNPGNYKIEVAKASLVFPSQLLSAFQTDGRRTDIYHGETIAASERDAVITANIPLDPSGEARPLRRLFWQRVGRTTQVTLSWLGIILTLISFYVSPRWYVGVLVFVHLLLFMIFHRLAVPAKIKSWGIVYDAAKKNPVGRVIARLFNAQFNKLVGTQITDGRGRYYFLAGDAPYYVTYEHGQYQPHRTDTIDLSGTEAANVAVDVRLQYKNAASVSPAPPFTSPPPQLPPITTPSSPATPPAPPPATGGDGQLT
ncbi:MAG: hypothetical protein HYV42_00340 [Candidatus Magasanikbacteria bacterium]|nr:hypothetical protein [Candidatus Magasanikbacteria bacterium]